MTHHLSRLRGQVLGRFPVETWKLCSSLFVCSSTEQLYRVRRRGGNMAARSALSARRQVSLVSVIVDTSHELSLRIENAKNHSTILWTYLMGMVCIIRSFSAVFCRHTNKKKASPKNSNRYVRKTVNSNPFSLYEN